MKIVGICLIKNEDLYIKQCLKNVLDFCDKIIVLDNLSSDNTVKEIKTLNSQKIELHSVNSPHYTNKFIEKYYSTDTWVLGVDGDEIYDPIYLKEFKKELLCGKWDDYWHIKGAQINVFELNDKTAKGHSNEFGCRGCGKLYNFNQVKKGHKAFLPHCERLHGLCVDSINDKRTKLLSFEENNLRFLHLCFINRSSNNIVENKKKYFIVPRPTTTSISEKRKLEIYACGKVVETNTINFFN